MKKMKSYYLGNLLIIASVLLFIYILYPLLLAYLFPTNDLLVNSKGFSLWIPKIHASGQIISNIDPWDEASYRPALKKGIALAKGYSYPDEEGPIYLFAHSSGPPWEQTHYNSVFLRLGELEKGDNIIIWYKNKEYKYEVSEKKEVNPTEIEAVTKIKQTSLILQTCTPLGTDWKRLLIYAEPI